MCEITVIELELRHSYQKKLKRKKYHSVEQFMKDIEQIFENAKLYNEDESQIYKDAVDLQVSSITLILLCND